MSDIGMSSAAGFLQVAEKLKKDMKDYEHEFERLNKELEDRNKIIVTKEQ